MNYPYDRLASMVGGCPWGAPLGEWTRPQLERGLVECERPGGESPVLGAALARELRSRKAVRP